MSRRLTYLPLLLTATFSPASFAAWHYGSGTGVVQHEPELKVEVGQKNADAKLFDITLTPDDNSELFSTLLQANNYATDGLWRIEYGFRQFDVSEPDVVQDSWQYNFEQTDAFFSVGQSFLQGESGQAAYLMFGVQYLDFSFSAAETIEQATTSYKLSGDMIDATVGLKADWPIYGQLVFHASAEAGFGSSEANTQASVALNYRIKQDWSLMLKAQYQAFEYEKGKSDQANWRMLESEDTSVGIYFYRIW
ncbi:hypothetical protein HR060_02360 [Catenovulum sp. SM1970]|uniref:hypothetical protein n=1 Tax=Marinifaba aquimaris TaxID=2741323 RepID=UPI001571B5E8|nr:hypothetical protein [Marinifaba aquimaris]NTS75698.1 hypothetical protein [Marinifaba aquimaris]